MKGSRPVHIALFAAAIGATSAGSMTALARDAGRRAGASSPVMGAPVTHAQPRFLGYYDGHKDTYLSTDTSSKN
jgi:hypothetical protein